MSASSEVVPLPGPTEAPPTPQDSYIHLPDTLNKENVYKFLDLAAKSDFYHDFHVSPKKKKEGEESKAEEDEEADPEVIAYPD